MAGLWMGRSHPLQYRAHNPAHHAAFDRLLSALLRQIFLNLVGQPRDRQRLQPHPSRPRKRSQENAIAAEDHVLDSRNALNLKRDGRLKCSDMARMHTKRLTHSEIFDHQFAGQLQPRCSCPRNPLQQEPVSAEDPRTERLLKADAKLDVRGCAQEAVAVNKIFAVSAEGGINETLVSKVAAGSVTFTLRSRSSMMHSGLMSRCIMPCPCA